MTKCTLAAALLTTALFACGLAAARPPDAPPNKPATGVVNLNTASPQQLQLLPGIGETKATRIASYRDKRRFRAVYELLRIKGIGRRTLLRLRPYLTLSGPTTLTRKPRARDDG